MKHQRVAHLHIGLKVSHENWGTHWVLPAKARFQRLLSFSVSIRNFIASNTLSHTFKRQCKNNRTGLLIECDQQSEIMQHFQGGLSDKIGILCNK